MACNTSSALALDIVRSEFDVPILGLIFPGAKAAAKKGRRIGVISTPATAQSNAYRDAIAEIEPNAEVWQVGCPEFVPLIEQDRINDPYTKKIATEYLTPLINNKIDTLIYGCTHYPHLEVLVKEILPYKVDLIDPAKSLVKATEQELELLGLKNHARPLGTRFAVSGNPDQFARLSHRWLGYTPKVEKVKNIQLVNSKQLPV
jgi:glutamate racemase